MCGSGSSTTTTARPTTRKTTTRKPTTTTTTTTTVATTTTKPTTQESTTTPQPITETPFHSTNYVDGPTASISTASTPSNKEIPSAIDRSGATQFGAIPVIGAVIGGVLLLLVALLCAFVIYRHRRSKAQTDESRRSNTDDSNVNGESASAAEMTSLSTYEVKQLHPDDEESVKPLYTQVKKKPVQNESDWNTSEIHLHNGNQALRVQTGVEKSKDQEKSTDVQVRGEIVDNDLYGNESVPQSIGNEKSQDEITETNGNVTLPKVLGRVTYENVETTAGHGTYENQSEVQNTAESDWGGAYDKLDRFDHVIANEKVIGENLYDM